MTPVVIYWGPTTIHPMTTTICSELLPTISSNDMKKLTMVVLLLYRYLLLDTQFLLTWYAVNDRTATFSQSYASILNADGPYKCQLVDGSAIQPNVSYNTLEDFKSCSTENGGFSSGALSSTFNSTEVFILTGFNGRCSVFYGPTPNIPIDPLPVDQAGVGGRLFYRLGDVNCTLGE